MRKEDQHLAYVLETGLIVSVSTPRSREDLPAAVTKTSSEGIWLEFLGPSPRTIFQKGDRVWIKFIDENGMCHWDGMIAKMEGEYFALVEVSDEGITLQRRSARRVDLNIPLSFMIMHPTERRVVSREVFEGETQSVSTTGLRFASNAPLKVGDHLQITLQVPSSVEVSVVTRVVRLEDLGEGKTGNAVAAQFLGMRPQDYEGLNAFIAEQEPG